MNLQEKMSAITAEIMTVAKNLEVGIGSGRYKAVSEADVLRAVKPIERKHGVYSYPRARRIVETGNMEGRNGSKSFYVFIETDYVFVNIENPVEELSITSYGMGVDPQDKAPGKAMTYCDKYALLKAYKIQTGDDPDQFASEEQSSIKQTRQTATRALKIGELKANALLSRLAPFGVTAETLTAKYKVASVADLTEQQHLALCKWAEQQEKGHGSQG